MTAGLFKYTYYIAVFHSVKIQYQLFYVMINNGYVPRRLVSWCFEPGQPRRIISALRETFIKRYIVERTNKAEIRPEEQSEKAESCRENI